MASAPARLVLARKNFMRIIIRWVRGRVKSGWQYDACVIAISRFRVPADDVSFAEDAAAAVARFAASPGCEAADLVRNLDEPELWAIVTR